MIKPVLAIFSFLTFFGVALASDLVEFEKATTVQVSSLNISGHGSGVLLESGLVLTAAHVTQHTGKNVVITFSDGIIATGIVVKEDPATDTAFIQTSIQTSQPRARLQCGVLNSGDPITVVGYPVSFPLSITYGHIMTPVPLEGPNKQPLVALDALIMPGNSGGPVFNAAGEVIGIADMASEKKDLGLMVPVNALEICKHA